MDKAEASCSGLRWIWVCPAGLVVGGGGEPILEPMLQEVRGEPPHEWLGYRWAGRQGRGRGPLEVLLQPSDACSCSVMSDSL